jgi:hypothetical protein
MPATGPAHTGGSVRSGYRMLVCLQFDMRHTRCRSWHPAAHYKGSVPRLDPWCTAIRIEDRRHRGAHGDSAHAAQDDHRFDLDDIHATIARRPEHRLGDPPVSVPSHEHHTGPPTVDRFRRLVCTDGPLRSGTKSFNIHGNSRTPTRPGKYTNAQKGCQQYRSPRGAAGSGRPRRYANPSVASFTPR